MRIAISTLVLLLLLTNTHAAPPKTLVDAVSAGDLASVQTFLQAGADPNDLTQKVPPLWVAANHGNVEITKALLAAGANPSLAGAGPCGVTSYWGI